jgi:hypothetical protein
MKLYLVSELVPAGKTHEVKEAVGFLPIFNSLIHANKFSILHDNADIDIIEPDTGNEE